MRVLVVDDEQSNLDELEMVFAQAGVIVDAVFCTNPYTALAALGQDDFDAAFLDIQMPGMSGIELAKRILDEWPQMMIVFITAYNNYAMEAFEVEAADYILKPIRAERVERTLRKLAGKKRVERIGQRIVIQGFGDYRVLCGDSVWRWDRRKTAELFWFLLTHQGQRVHKESICAALWPTFSLERALPNLQVTVSRLRRELEDLSHEQLSVEYESDIYCLTIGGCDYDVAVFRHCVETGESALAKAVVVYEGDYLDKAGWLWAESERENLRQRYQRAVLKLANIYVKVGAYERAENLFEECMSKCAPEQQIATKILELAALQSGWLGLAQAFARLQSWYMQSSNSGMPRSVKWVYTQLCKVHSS